MATASTTSPSGSTARKPAAKRTAAKPSTARKPTAKRSTAEVVGEYAERAVLIPVGAALTARDRVVTSVSDTITSYSTPTKAQTQLRKFERRGSTARNRLEREVRKTRTRVERELRQRRSELEQQVGSLEKRRESLTKDSTELVSRLQERVLALV